MNDIKLITAVILALADIPEGGPASSIYMALGMDSDKWQLVRDILLRTKFITISSHWVRITPKGQAVAKEINLALKDKQ